MVSEECTTDEGGGISWLGLKGGGGAGHNGMCREHGYAGNSVGGY